MKHPFEPIYPGLVSNGNQFDRATVRQISNPAGQARLTRPGDYEGSESDTLHSSSDDEPCPDRPFFAIGH